MTDRNVMVSVIVPVYNAAYTVVRALSSVLNTLREKEIEIIVVDDCSTDDTAKIITELQKKHSNIQLFSMPENSGGPSTPRNMGIEKATGEYITFLDDDDWFNTNSLLQMVDYARQENLDFLKGYLIVVNGQKKSVFNRLHEIPKDSKDTVKSIISNHSTNSDFLVRRSVLLENNIRYASDIKIGEDTIFTLKILAACSSVGYVDSYFLYHTNTALDFKNLSSTQKCSDREINDQITAWEESEKIAAQVSLSYYGLRLHIGFRNLLLSIVRFSDGIKEETYNRLHQFCLLTKSFVAGKMNLHKRYEDLYKAILAGDYKQYLDAAKRRLLIAGYDLKFVLPLVPYFSKKYQVLVDEWRGHAAHDKKKSEEYAKWADIFWCEWLLGNAVFYTKMKNNNQRLVIRAHRFELGREFGAQIDYAKVDMVFAVSYYYFEGFAEKFSIPLNKMRLLPNYVEEGIYSDEKLPNSNFNIGIVGFLPSLKGYMKALIILKILKDKDSRFKLYAMGKQPHELSWVQSNPAEYSYYQNCENYIYENKLTDSVIYGGHQEQSELYKNIRYVLSLSDIESFHLAPAEGACAGAMGLILRRPGVEYIYPKKVIFDSLDDIADAILKAAGDERYFKDISSELRRFVLKNYNINKFLNTANGFMQKLFLMTE